MFFIDSCCAVDIVQEVGGAASTLCDNTRYLPSYGQAGLLVENLPEATPHRLPLSHPRSDYDDWRPSLASLLQPIPFPKE